MKVGYIQEYDLKLNPHLTEKFKFREEPFTRHISSRGDKVRSKMFYGSIDYDVALLAEGVDRNLYNYPVLHS